MTVVWLDFIRQTVLLPNSVVDLSNQHHSHRRRRQYHHHRHGDDLAMNCCCCHLRAHHCLYHQTVAFAGNADQRNVPVINECKAKNKNVYQI